MMKAALFAAALATAAAQVDDGRGNFPSQNPLFSFCQLDSNCRQFDDPSATCVEGKCSCSFPVPPGLGKHNFCWNGPNPQTPLPTVVVFSFDYPCAITMENWNGAGSLQQLLYDATQAGFARAQANVNVSFTCGSSNVVASGVMTEDQARDGAALAEYEQNQKLEGFLILSKRLHTTIQLGGSQCWTDDSGIYTYARTHNNTCAPASCDQGYRLVTHEENGWVASCERVPVDDDELGDGAIVGFVLGCVLGLVVLVALVLICTHREPEAEELKTEPTAA